MCPWNPFRYNPHPSTRVAVDRDRAGPCSQPGHQRRCRVALPHPTLPFPLTVLLRLRTRLTDSRPNAIVGVNLDFSQTFLFLPVTSERCPTSARFWQMWDSTDIDRRKNGRNSINPTVQNRSENALKDCFNKNVNYCQHYGANESGAEACDLQSRSDLARNDEHEGVDDQKE
jgi:hypothetical protein